MRSLFLGTALLLPAVTARAGIIAQSTFDSSLDGWTSNTPAQISWSSSGGNPGGFMLFQDETTVETFVFAPASFLGNLSSLNNVGIISYDQKIIEETDFISVFPYEIESSGPGGDAVWIGPLPQLSANHTTGWVNVSAPLIQADWTIKSGSWNVLLQDVTQLSIYIEAVNGGTAPAIDHEGVDNVELSAVPVPTGWALAAVGVTALAGYSMRRKGGIVADGAQNSSPMGRP